MLGHVWQRLAGLLVAHTQAEEQTCYAYVASLGLSRRKELGRQWCAFMATWPFDGLGRGREPGHGPEESPAGCRAEG